MKQDTKRMHYLPKCYLKSFGDNNQVWRISKVDGRLANPNIVNVGVKNKLYSDDLEKAFSNDIEGPFSQILKKVIARKEIELSDKQTIANFIEVLWKRSPYGLDRFKNHFPDIFKRVKQGFNQQIDQLISEDPDNKNLFNEQRDNHRLKIEDYDDERQQDIWHRTFEYCGKISKLLQEMKWLFFSTSGADTFLTCDNPLFLAKGASSDLAEFSFPISSNLMLVGNGFVSSDLMYAKASHQTVITLNRRTVVNAEQFIVAKENYRWLASFVRKNHTEDLSIMQTIR